MQNWLRMLPGRRFRRLLCPSAVSMIAALALPASALAAGFRITPHIANHTPRINVKWPVELRITKGATKLSGTVVYQFLFDGTVVAVRPQHGAYKFKNGVYRDQLLFTPDSRGQHLTLRFVVKTKYGTEHVDWNIQPEP